MILQPLKVLSFGLLLASGQAWADSISQPTIAIIIDDMGNHVKTGRQLINLPYPLTLAFLPHRKHTAELARNAHYQNKEIMLHMPMANTLGLDLGAGGLTADMGKLDLTITLRKAIRSVPYIQGINNHMGSALTQNRDHMSWVMEELYNYPLYFVDSRTIATSVASRTAQQYAIPNLSRDVFLDHWQTRKSIHKQFGRLIKLAKEKGSAVAIGHPHQVTADYLEWALPRLDQQGIRIATVSGLWAIRNEGSTMFGDRKQLPSNSFALTEKVTSKKSEAANKL
ncbi:divergent polysaccharide deacetylase family protein [Alkalimarinus sediminis]|uniref:Divergent polysaccharide deacetylase family protein n=1 Tax=Alkalimarinus sediminis TaxID=1632866 RepID=A0A9E8KJW7_9ALTE|nr:divergent polysaccharide deacetylase family protein [Alkalimarinus sediminis]UZW75471.1 divergent polysaccharide deacetylase family protein [Alkalimarinus sediminis]